MARFPRENFGSLHGRQKQPPGNLSKRRRKLLALGLAALLAFSTASFAVSARHEPPSAQPAKEQATFPSSNKNQKSEFVPGRVLVRYRSEEVATLKESKAARLAIKGLSEPEFVEGFDASRLVKGLRLVRVAAEDTIKAVAAFKADPDVLYAEPDYIVRTDAIPADTRFSEMWALKNTGQLVNGSVGGTPGADIDAELAWNTSTGSNDVVVGIIDTGVDINHPDLAGNVWVNPGESGAGKESNGLDDDANGRIDDVNGWDFNGNNKTVYDGPGICSDPASDAFESTIDEHGTHVAGTIGATGNNGLGVTGINWNVKLMPLKFLGACGSGPTSAAISGINYAVMMRSRGVNIRALNNSWGGGNFSQSLLNAIQAAGNAGILFVASAGNSSANTDQSPHYPSNYNLPNVISVASTTRFDALSSFSNFGFDTVHLAAPGSLILSTTPENSYSFFSGTSMAAPHVTGVAALVSAAVPAISMGQLRGAILYSGDSLAALSMKTVTGRRLNAHNAIQSATENDVTPPGAIADFHISSQTGRAISLAWTAPGDDGGSGQASLYEISFTDAAGGAPIPLLKSIPGPAGSQQGATVNVPYRHTSGTITIRTFDNAGNEGPPSVLSASVSLEAGDPYTITKTPATGVSTSGLPLALNDDDAYETEYVLPFAFQFFGQPRSSVTISTNGALYFSTPPTNDAGSSIAGLNTQTMIAGMWDDLRTDRLGGDVFVVQPDADRIVFRWEGSTYANSSQPISFEIELRRDGTIQVRYGNGNAGLLPVVGISAGERDPYVVDSHTSETSQISLANAQTVTFAPRSVAPPVPPANDNFAAAQSITGCSGSVAGTTIGATGQAGEPSHDPAGTTGGGSVWYLWQAPGNGSMTIDTTGSVTNFDTVLAVYTGNSVGALGTAVARNDDIETPVITTSRVTFNASAGTIYKIAVDGWDGATGNFALNWTQTGCAAKTDQSITFPPLNDKIYGDPPFIVSATASSGLPVSFQILSGPATISGSTVTITGAGTITIRASQGGDTNYNPATPVDRSFNVGKATPLIVWSNPADITYGTALSGGQLNATTSVAGTFSYTPVAGTVLNAGTNQNISVNFTPNDTGNYNSTSKSVFINVLKANQTINFDLISSKTFGDAPFSLSATASSGLPVSFAVVSGPATISGSTVTITGAGTITIRASQGGDTNYNPATPVDRSFNVGKATPLIVWSNPADITYGTALSGGQLNATTSVAGTFSYTPVAGTVLNAGTNQNISVNFTPNDTANYNSTSKSVFINVLKADQTINFDLISSKTFGDAPFSLSATASSGLPVSFGVVSGPATISGSTVTITGAGTITIRASQGGDTNYNPATPVDRSFNVGKATPLIVWNNPADITYGTALSGGQLNATTSVAGTFSYTPVAGTVLNAGTNQNISVNFTPNDTANYNSTSKSVFINVLKADQTINFDLISSKTFGDAPFSLSATASSGLPVSFQIISGPAIISGNTVTISGAGTVIVRAAQAGNSNYNIAAVVDRQFDIVNANAGIALTNLAHIYDGTAKFATATTTPPGLSVTITYSRNGSPVTSPTEFGAYSVTATITSPGFSGATSGTLVINKSTPVVTWNNPSKMIFGTALSGAQLNATANVPGSFLYDVPAGTVLAPGTHQLSVTFIPTDVTNYNSASATVQVAVGPAVLTEEGTNRAIALDSATFLSGPFRIVSLLNFSSDQRTRVMLFTSNLGPVSASDISVTMQGISLPIEGVGTVRGLDQASYIVVKLTDGLPSGSLPVIVVLRGVASNTATLNIAP